MSLDPISASRPAPGAAVTFRWRKWDGSPHWVHDCLYLGSDEWGDWVGQPTGFHSGRPGRELTAATDNVTLVPPGGQYALTVNAPPATYRVYIDLAWDVRWSDTDAAVVEGVDMDLDVVLAVDERGLFIDDRDEWDEHRVHYGYPLDVVERLEALTIDLEGRVRAADPPFDDATADRWLARLALLTAGR